MKSLIIYIVFSFVIFSQFKDTSADLRDDLISTANILLSKADAELKVLQQQNRTADANAIQTLETQIRALIVNVSSAKNDTELIRLQQQLGEAEGSLILLLERLGVQISEQDLKRELIIYGEELIVRANQEIDRLQAENRTSSVQLIQTEERQINSIVARLRNATLTLDIYQLENELASAELRLQAELARLGIGWDTTAARNILISRAQLLQNRTNAIIARLRSDGRGEDIVAGLVDEERRIASLVLQLQNATNVTVIQALEFSLGQAEFRLELELSILNETSVSGAERQALIRQIEDVVSQIILEIRRLQAANRNLEAEGLLTEQQLLVQLDVQVRNVVNPLDFLYLENRFEQIRIRVLNTLRQLGVAV